MTLSENLNIGIKAIENRYRQFLERDRTHLTEEENSLYSEYIARSLTDIADKDAVHVVRCQKCQRYNGSECRWYGIKPPTWYCADGEKKYEN